MTLDEFRQSLTRSDSPPAGLSPPLQALWHDARGEWDRAHQLAQDVDSQAGAWVHAYLHRKEGDEGNAAYWYKRAAREICVSALEEEWESIVDALLTAA